MHASARASPRPLTGRLGRYDLLGRIAVGGMAELYLARAEGIEGFEKLVVLKRILPSKAVNGEFVKMFLHEARLAATLHHTNVVQVYDIGEADGTYFFTMEYIHGRDLRELAKVARDNRIALPLNHIMKTMIGVAGGLHYAHEKCGNGGEFLNLVHRDISPSNVIVSFAGGVKLVDFGIAKATTAEVHTSVGTLKGKIPYMSPEQCRGEKLDRRSDIFSLGVLLWEFTTARRLWTGGHELILIERISREEAPRPSSIVPNYPPALEQIVMKALSKRREDRHDTAEELQMELEDFSHEHHLPMSSARLGRFLQEVFPDDSSSQMYRLDGAAPATRASGGKASTEVLDEPNPRMSIAPTMSRALPSKHGRPATGPQGLTAGTSKPGPRRTVPQGSVHTDDFAAYQALHPSASQSGRSPGTSASDQSSPHGIAPQFPATSGMDWNAPRPSTDVLPNGQQGSSVAGTDVLQGHRPVTGADVLADVTQAGGLDDTDPNRLRAAAMYAPAPSGQDHQVHETTSLRRASAVGFLVFAIIVFIAALTAVATVLYYRAKQAPKSEIEVHDATPGIEEPGEPGDQAQDPALAGEPEPGPDIEPEPAPEVEPEPELAPDVDPETELGIARDPEPPKKKKKKKKTKKKLEKQPFDLDSPIPPS